MNIKFVLSLTVLFAGLAVVFVISSDTIIGNDVLVSANNMNTSNSEIHTNNDDLKNTKKSETSSDNPHALNLTDESEINSKPIRSIGSFTTIDPYKIKDQAQLVMIGTITSMEKGTVMEENCTYGCELSYTKYFLNVDEILGGTEEYEHDTIEVVNRFPSRKTLYNEGDQAFIMVNRSHHIFPDAWWPLSSEYGMYKVNGDRLIGEDMTISKNKLFE